MAKHKDFIIPFTWAERKVCINDQVLFYPPQTEIRSFQFPGWESSELFGNSWPVCVEYCSGNGTWILERAKNDLSVNWVAIEKRVDRAKKIWSKLKNYNLRNMLLGLGEGLSLTKACFPQNCVDQVFINFPDPWPKRRHAKNRIVSPPFVEELFRILKIGGSVTLVTDDENYSNIMIKVMSSHPGFSSMLPSPYFEQAHEDYGTSFFESLFRSQGKIIRMHKFERISSSRLCTKSC
jgi:tRNA (guanine-N7-)-methyltransferase